MNRNFADRPNVVPWPPILFAGAAALSLLLEWLAPIGLGSPPEWVRLAAGGVSVLGLALDLAAIRQMRRHRANVLPHRAATALVTDGVFRLSRNPIYLGNTLMLLVLAVAVPIYWLLVTLAPLMVLITVLVINREERHLAVMFGAEWVRYCRTTRRWL